LAGFQEPGEPPPSWPIPRFQSAVSRIDRAFCLIPLYLLPFSHSLMPNSPHRGRRLSRRWPECRRFPNPCPGCVLSPANPFLPSLSWINAFFLADGAFSRENCLSMSPFPFCSSEGSSLADRGRFPRGVLFRRPSLSHPAPDFPPIHPSRWNNPHRWTSLAFRCP